MENIVENFFVSLFSGTLVVIIEYLVVRRIFEKPYENKVDTIVVETSEGMRTARRNYEGINDILFYIGLSGITATTSITAAFLLRFLSAAYYNYNPDSLLGMITNFTGYSDFFLVCIIIFMWLVSSTAVYFIDLKLIERGSPFNDRLLVSILLSYITAVSAYFVVPFIIGLLLFIIVIIQGFSGGKAEVSSGHISPNGGDYPSGNTNESQSSLLHNPYQEIQPLQPTIKSPYELNERNEVDQGIIPIWGRSVNKTDKRIIQTWGGREKKNDKRKF